MKRLLILSIFSILFSFTSFSQGDFCVESEPFCTSNLYSFPAGVNSGTAEPGPAYGCLSSQPNPAWYHMKIAISGNINIYMYSTPLKDIDFICWGPFDDPIDPCVAQLTANKIVDCSYSPNPTETCNIPNGIEGEYYILLITNYSNSPCDITFEKQSGTGETDCTIVPPPIGSNSPICYGDHLSLWADDFANAAYHWTGPDGFESYLQNPTIFNMDFEKQGQYDLVITVNGSDSDPVSTFVNVFAKPDPDFTFNDACFGDTTFFFDNSSVDPPTSEITSWKWEFGDGQVGFGADISHLYTDAQSYEVKLTTYTSLMGCPRSEIKTVNVYNSASVEAGEDVSIPNGWSTQLDGTVDGGSGDYDLLWTPENLLTDATIQDPTTVAMGATQVFTLTVTDAVSQCVNKDSTTVIVTGGPLSVTASANPMVICEDDIVNLSANPSGGSGNNIYSWTSNPPGFTADIKEPSHFPMETTTYYVEVFDGQTTVTGEITVQVKPRPIGFAGDDKSITVGTSTTIDGANVTGGSGSFNYSWSPSSMLEDASILSPKTVVLNDNVEYSLVVNDDNGCQSVVDNVWIFTGGDGLNVNPTASPAIICQQETTMLSANAFGGGGSYTYSWSNSSGWSSSDENPVVNPMTTTTYDVDVNDGFKTVSNSLTVTVNSLPIIDLLPEGYVYYSQDTVKACVRDSVTLNAGNAANPPSMNYLWSNSATAQKIKVITNGSWIDFQTHSVEVQNPVTLCSDESQITVFFDFNECQIGVDELSSLSNNIKISPNPTNGTFTIDILGLEDDLIVKVENINGQIIHQDKIINVKENPSKQIDISGLPNGIYILSILNSKGVYNSRIIKQ